MPPDNVMARELAYVIFNVDLGWVGILGSAQGLLRTTLPQHSADEVRQQLADSINDAIWAPHLFKESTERLRIYFSGRRITFPDRLDLSWATHFQRQVWEATKLIPYSETQSYLWVAKQIKKPRAMRAVGQALGRNPLPIIVPCHRVIASNGKLGGFGGGLEMKKQLLSLEAATTIR